MYFQCIVVLVCSLFISGTVSQSQCNRAQACFADVMDSDCPIPGQIMAPNAGIFGCCPGCVQPSGNTIIDMITYFNDYFHNITCLHLV